MKTFKDATGREWALDLTLSAVKRVRSLLDVDLLALEVGDPPLLTRLGMDVVLLCDVIFVLVKPQADSREVTDEEFGAALGGQVILAAQTAFYDELVDFFRGLGRKDLVKAVKTQHKIIDMVIKRVETHLAGLDLEAAIEEVEKEISGSASTDLPVS